MTEAQALGFALHKSPCRRTNFSHQKELLSVPLHSEAVSLLETWREFKNHGGMIVGRNFPTRRWASLLPHIVLVEKMRGARDFRVRLAGFGLFCYYGFDLCGKRLSEVHDEGRFRMRYRELDDVLGSGRPHISRASMYDGDDPVVAREILSLPVLGNDTRTRLVLVASFWTHRGWLN